MKSRTVKRWSSGGRSLKRAYMRKVESVSCSHQMTADVPSEQSELTPSGAARRARTSAAMIGLALSMSGTSLLIPRQDDKATAAESKMPDTTITAVPSTQTSSSAVAGSAPSITVVEHVVRERQTLLQVADQYQVSIWSLMAANDLSLSSTLKVGQVLKVPVLGTSQVTDESSSEATEFGSLAHSSPLVASANLDQLPEVGEGERLQDASRTERDSALNRLRQQRDKLRESLAELRYEESDLISLASEDEGTLDQVGAGSETVSETVAQVEQRQVDNQLPNSPMVGDRAQPASQGRAFTESSRQEVAALSGTTPSSHRSAVQSEGSQPRINPSESVVYRVNPGDTVAAIARAHNIPQSLLIEMNHLSDPNVIFVGQVLTVPSTQPATAEIPVTVAFENTASSNAPSVAPVVVSPSQASFTGQVSQPIATGGSIQVVSVPTVPTVAAEDSQGGMSSSQSLETPTQLASHAQPDSQVAAVPEVGTPANHTLPTSLDLQVEPDAVDSGSSSRFNPYVENLLSEIRSLRQRNQPETTSVVPPTQPLTVAVSSTPSAEISTDEFRVNPQFRRATAAEQNFDTIPAASSNQTDSSTESQRELVATAPLGSESYAPLLQPVTGRMVSPDLPPLPGADTFLPEDGGIFNGYIWPARGILTSGYGWRWGRMHQGIDIASDVGTPIYAAADGVIEYAGWNSGGYGNMVEIRHADGSMTRYAHMNAIHVAVGQQIDQGEQIGEMGSTGYSTGPHLHFEVHLPNQGTVNPMAYLPAQ